MNVRNAVTQWTVPTAEIEARHQFAWPRLLGLCQSVTQHLAIEVART